MEIEKNLTVTRKEGEGIMGEKSEGFRGTTMKDTWVIMSGGGNRGRMWERLG